MSVCLYTAPSLKCTTSGMLKYFDIQVTVRRDKFL